MQSEATPDDIVADRLSGVVCGMDCAFICNVSAAFLAKTYWRASSLWRRVLDELNTLGDVALEASVASLEQLLLIVVG